MTSGGNLGAHQNYEGHRLTLSIPIPYAPRAWLRGYSLKCAHSLSWLDVVEGDETGVLLCYVCLWQVFVFFVCLR